MKRVLVLVEGQTEETFVRDVLAPHLLDRNVALIPKILVTKRVKSGGHFKGGVTSYDKVKGDVQRLLADTHAERVTTMLSSEHSTRTSRTHASSPTSRCMSSRRCSSPLPRAARWPLEIAPSSP